MRDTIRSDAPTSEQFWDRTWLDFLFVSATTKDIVKKPCSIDEWGELIKRYNPTNSS